ncbi:unnamed protein product [Haemonchus placei]|uniref:LSM domain-containing protein n=1 Tax=Haemonchus placei TaxID=6290 RepID=A0A3P7UWQ7_HAEPC|nr:unnamed protein product [Haemonchus placei]
MSTDSLSNKIFCSSASIVVQFYMGRWMEVELTDGRLIRGQMMCTDRRPNFILGRRLGQLVVVEVLEDDELVEKST